MSGDFTQSCSDCLCSLVVVVVFQRLYTATVPVSYFRGVTHAYKISLWIRDVTQCYSPQLTVYCLFYFQGVLHAYNISHLVRTTMNLHVAMSKPMTKSCLLSLCRLIELLKVPCYILCFIVVLINKFNILFDHPQIHSCTVLHLKFFFLQTRMNL